MAATGGQASGAVAACMVADSSGTIAAAAGSLAGMSRLSDTAH